MRGADAVASLRRALPYACILALGLGIAVSIGANLSNATPSRDHPFGWPGAATFEGGVATVRPELVLAASLPGLLWGIASTSRLDPRRHTLAQAAPRAGYDLAAMAGAVLVATAIGAWQAAGSPSSAYQGFFVAHWLLAASFYAIGCAAASASRKWALPIGLGSWVLFVAIVDDWVKWRLFREAGYNELAAGHFPSWFYVAQAASPLSGYRATLILWRKGFRDYVEHAALDKAALPPWMTATTFAGLQLVLWVVLPLGIAATVWYLRTRSAQMIYVETPTVTAVPKADDGDQC